MERQSFSMAVGMRLLRQNNIKISRMSRKEFDTKNAVTRVDEMKKPVELVEVGEDIGIRAKDDVSSSLAARYAKAYSERMSTVNPEFE